MKERVTISDLKDENNLDQCECGNWTHESYLRHDENGRASCPNCQFECMSGEITSLIQLAKEIADPELSKEDVDNMIKSKYKKMYGIDNIDLLNINDN